MSESTTDILKNVTNKKQKGYEVKPAKDYNKGQWSDAAVERYETRARNDLNELMESPYVDDLHVYVAVGNRKTGAEVPSVSLLPVVDCGNCGMCKKGCYDVRHDVISKDCYKNRLINSAIAHTDLDRFFQEVYDMTKFVNTFRFHVGGDILSLEYFRQMVKLAEKRPDMKILAFTKMYDIVNTYLDETGGYIPLNLKVVFSAWPGIEVPNPYHLPMSTIVLPSGKSFDETGQPTLRPVDYLCDGNCTMCNNNQKGCWVLGRGQRVGINFH